MKIGVYVGSFNPVHKGHIEVATYLLDNCYLDKVLMVPSPNYWDKNNLIDINKRIDMIKFYKNEKIEVDIETSKFEKTYQVLENLHQRFPKDELYLIIGADNLEKFHMWDRINEILKYNIIVMPRGDVDIDNELKRFNNAKFIVPKEFKGMGISSTLVRSDLSLKYMIKEEYDYIMQNGLYKKEVKGKCL